MGIIYTALTFDQHKRHLTGVICIRGSNPPSFTLWFGIMNRPILTQELEKEDTLVITAVNIHAELWHELFGHLVADEWHVSYWYDSLDLSLDFDLIIFEKNGEEIIFGWDLWFDGEIQCSHKRMSQLQVTANQELQIGQPLNLYPKAVRLYREPLHNS